jgi:putrescine transport system permease protein
MSTPPLQPASSFSGSSRSRPRARAVGRALVLAPPTVWLVLFSLAPFLIVGFVALGEAILARPPFIPPISAGPDGQWLLTPQFTNFARLIEDPLYFSALIGSLKVAALSTLICLIIAYPMAWVMARAAPVWRAVWLMAVIVPFLTSFVLRIYALMALLANKGIVNELLIKLGLIEAPMAMLQTGFAVYAGVIYTYLPFMILPLYAGLRRIDTELLDAAADLGAGPFTRFFTLGVPLSWPGALAGSLLVFVPVMGEVIVPALVGGPDTLMIGRVVWDEFFLNRDWPMAAAIAVGLLALLVVAFSAGGKLFQQSPASAAGDLQ